MKVHELIDADALDAHYRVSSLVSFKRPRNHMFVRENRKSQVGRVSRRMLVAGEYELTSDAKKESSR